MIERTNELVYVKRHYFLPFKPILDSEYKKFGYKKCDVKKETGKHVNTCYYVRHRERPQGMCDALYTLNLPFSYHRSLIVPVQILIFLVSVLIEEIINCDLLIENQLIWILAVIPSMLISAVLSNLGHKAYIQNDTNGKLDSIMNSRGWDAWTSYKDNDPRFTPPGSQKSAPAEKGSTNRTSPVSPNRTNSASTVNNGGEDEYITLLTANGEEIDFLKVAVIQYRGKIYAILQPAELMEGMADDEALVFRTFKTADGSDSFEIELDDKICDAVFAEYDRMYENTNSRR